MEFRKAYHRVNPELLYDEVKDFALNQGLALAENKLETYTVAGDTSSFIHRGNLTFKPRGRTDIECLRVHIVGSANGETRVIASIDEEFFPAEKMDALKKDLDYIFSSYEVTHPEQ